MPLCCWQIPGQVIMLYFVLLTDTRPSHQAWLCLVDRYQAKSSCLTLSCWQIPGQVIMPDFVLLTDTWPSPSTSSCHTSPPVQWNGLTMKDRSPLLRYWCSFSQLLFFILFNLSDWHWRANEGTQTQLSLLLCLLCDIFSVLISSLVCWFCAGALGLILFQIVTDTGTKGEWDSSVVRVPDSWLKGCGFKSLQEQQENFLL